MVRIIVSALIIFSIARVAISEYEAVIPKPILKIESPCTSKKQKALDARLTGIHPTCTELTTTDAPVARRVGSDSVLIIPDAENNTYLKIGRAPATANESPSITWQGASLDGAISHGCVVAEQETGK